MWRCSVCGKDHTEGLVCDRCGFMISTDYEQYKTLSPYLPENAKPVSIRKAKWASSHAAANPPENVLNDGPFAPEAPAQQQEPAQTPLDATVKVNPARETTPAYDPDATVKVNPAQGTTPAYDPDATVREASPQTSAENGEVVAIKKRSVALLFCLIFGFFGVSHFYEKCYFRGIFHLGLMGFFAYIRGTGALGEEVTALTSATILLLWLIDFFRILSRPVRYTV